MNLARAILAPRIVGRTFRRMTGRILHRPEIKTPTETIGTAYGSHTIRVGSLNGGSIVYSFGVGEDVSFDLGLIKRYGCVVHTFDPTPRSLAWAKEHITEPRLIFRPIGIAANDREAEFTAPKNTTHVSYSRSSDGQDEDSALKLTVRTLPTIMADLGHDRIDLLKMDIEGFEYEVLESMIETKVRPTQIAVEFHHGMYGYPNASTHRAVAVLQDAGYALFHVSDTGREYSFCAVASLH